jgi:addiction module HigA family antidote
MGKRKKPTAEESLAPVHPGELLAEILGELGVSAYALAKAIGKAPIQVSRILSGKASVTADMARLIGAALGTSAEMWVNLQAMYDLEMSRVRTPVVEVKPLVSDRNRISA